MGVTARWIFARSGRLWVDQHGSCCGVRHVYAAGSRGLERVGGHGVLGRRRRCRHPWPRGQQLRGHDNGPHFWGYVDYGRYARDLQEGGRVHTQCEELVAFYEAIYATPTYIEGGHIERQVRSWF